MGSVAEAFGCNRTAVLLRDGARNELEIIALRGFNNVHLKGYRFQVGGQGMATPAAATARMHYAPDVRKDPYYVVSESTTLSEVDIPLISRGKLIGIFNSSRVAGRSATMRPRSSCAANSCGTFAATGIAAATFAPLAATELFPPRITAAMVATRAAGAPS